MGKLKVTYDSADAIPEGYAELYVEKNGKFELSGIEGIKTQGDIDKLSTALTKERAEHKATKEALGKWGDLKPDEVPAKLEELEEVRAQLATATKEGKIDEPAIQARVDAALARVTGPLQRDKTALERQLDASKKANEEKDRELGTVKAERIQDQIRGTLRDAAVQAKLLGTAIDDAVMVGDRMFERTDDGKIVTRDGVGVTPGLEPKEWFKDMQEKRPHWWPASVGGGARGGIGDTGTGKGNPWSAEGWNVTEQGRVVRAQGEAKAKEMAERVGSKLGATKPTVAAKAA